MFLSGGKSVSPGENGEAVEKVDSPTEEIHKELRKQLLEITEDLLVKPGQYFDKNWHSCRESWVFCRSRRNHPTEGIYDTQPAESYFRAIKNIMKRSSLVKQLQDWNNYPIILKVLQNRHNDRVVPKIIEEATTYLL